MHLKRLSCILSRPWIRGKTITSIHIWTLVKSRATSSQSPTRSLPVQSALSYRRQLLAMAPQQDLKKQYMSSGTKPKEKIATPRPSASILLISPSNEILLLHRVQTSSSFPSAHVFPGGNLSPSQDGEIPAADSPKRHVDGPAYRLGAIRECFEESGILLAKKCGGSDSLLEVEETERERARKEIHAGKLKFLDWVEAQGGIVDTESLIPFTRWITPANLPKRFTTQMYIYFLPLTQTTAKNISSKSVIPVPTSDGGVEHTAAIFAPCSTWLQQASKNEIILYPPQFYLMYLLSHFLAASTSSPPSIGELQKQRDEVMEFLEGDGENGKGVKWEEKVMSPIGIGLTKDGRSILSLNNPGPELQGSERGGDENMVVLVRFGKRGPRDLEVRESHVVLEEVLQRKAKL